MFLRRIFLINRSWCVPWLRSARPLACAELAAMIRMPSFSHMRPNCVRGLFAPRQFPRRGRALVQNRFLVYEDKLWADHLSHAFKFDPRLSQSALQQKSWPFCEDERHSLALRLCSAFAVLQPEDEVRHEPPPTGYIWRKGHAWYGRWWEDVLVNGNVVHKQRCKKLAEYGDRYRSQKDVRPLLDDYLRPLNAGRIKPESTLTITEYVERFYLPYAQDNCKPSTYSGYKTPWGMYLAPRLTKAVLRDFRTADAASLFDERYRVHRLGRSTLRHLKSFLSGMFSYVINQGVLDGINPMREAHIPRKAAGPADTHATSPEEVIAIMDALEKTGHIKARAAIALMFFAGLRPGEARGAQWEDYDGRQLIVRKSVWRTYATEPKSADSVKPVPVIELLRSLLVELRAADGNPVSGPILRGPKTGHPLNLDNLARREVRMIPKDARIEWHGWYSLRRGIATMVHSVEKDPMAAKGLLRHASVITTQTHYIKEVTK